MKFDDVLSITGDYTYKHDFQRAAIERNYSIDYVKTMDDALSILLDKDYVLIVIRADTVDYMSKLQLIKRLKNIPILVLSYKNTQDMITPMKMGADFFVAITFNFNYIIEFCLNIIQFHRNCINNTPHHLSFRCLYINLKMRTVLLKGKPVNLTPKEFEVLRILLEKKGEFLSYQSIFKAVWGEEYIDNSHNILSCVIYRLKQKLNAEPSIQNCIENKRYVGYSFTNECHI